MSKKLLFLISFVLVLVLTGSASAAAKFDYRACWWSDLGPGHDWNEPNNWWTMDRYWDDDNNDDIVDTRERKFYVKEPNQVPDVNTVVFVGKGTPRIDYPEFLHFNPPPNEPTISSGTTVASNVWVGGGYSQDPNGDSWPGYDVSDPDPNLWTPPIYHWDPCLAHELTVNGGTLNIGTPQTWVGYDDQYDSMPYGTMESMGYFNGMGSGSCLRIGTVGWFATYLGPGLGEGTMHMNGGTVNVGGHMEVGAWEENLGTLNMTDGVINITQGLYCPHAWDGTGRVNLWGGTINARYIFMNDAIRTTGLIDIAGGKFILSRGNEVQELTDYSNGIGTLGVGSVLLTAYGVGDGDIITYDGNYPDANGKRADLSIDYDVSNEGKTTVQAFTTDPDQAWNPSPPNGAGNAKGTIANISRPVLSWSAGDGATSHEVYFDANEALVSARDVSVRKQTAYSPSSWTVDSDLMSFQTYYWAIDENPGPILGQVWDFTMANLAKAGSPSPEDGERDVSTDLILSWAAGIFVTGSGHQVYFGTNRDDVNDATTSVDPNSVYQGAQSGTTFDVKNYDPNALEFSTTYYWRIDESNGVTTYKGDVWSFTTDSHLTVDDFDSYATPTALWDVWDDYWVNLSGSEVFIEQGIVRDGNSLKFLYDGDTTIKGVYVGSVIDANIIDLAIGPDWTVSDARALVLNFYGHPDNSATVNDKMWVELEDTSSNTGVVIYDGDPNDVKEAEWHEWNIDLGIFDACGVSLTNLDKVHLGFGNFYRTGQVEKGGTGTVYFDDIQVWPQRCVPAESSAADFTGDCVVNGLDLDIMLAEWLAHDGSVLATAPTDVNLVARWEFEGNYNDSNGTNHGVPYGDAEWVSDPVRGYVLSCDGDDDYVEIPGSNTPGGVFDITSDITVSAWINFDELKNNWPAIIAKGDDTESWRLARSGTPGTGDTIEFCASGVILYYDYGELNPYGNVTGNVPVADGQWHHVAGVYDGSKICLYVDGIVDTCLDASGSFNSSTYNVWIGSNPVSLQGWTGLIDDVRVYNAALTPGNIAVLAGKEGYIYVPLSIPAGQVNVVPKDPPGAPFDPNNLDIINFLDYGKLAENWLKESPFPPQP
jgi:hypothetical protein